MNATMAAASAAEIFSHAGIPHEAFGADNGTTGADCGAGAAAVEADTSPAAGRATAAADEGFTAGAADGAGSLGKGLRSSAPFFPADGTAEQESDDSAQPEDEASLRPPSSSAAADTDNEAANSAANNKEKEILAKVIGSRSCQYLYNTEKNRAGQTARRITDKETRR